MAQGDTRRKSKEILKIARWFHERHAADVPIVGCVVTLLGAMRALNRSSVVSLFQKAFAEPYADAIRDRDESAFLAAPVPIGLPPTMAGLTVGFHAAWDRMTPEDKAEAWDRLRNVL